MSSGFYMFHVERIAERCWNKCFIMLPSTSWRLRWTTGGWRTTHERERAPFSTASQHPLRVPFGSPSPQLPSVKLPSQSHRLAQPRTCHFQSGSNRFKLVQIGSNQPEKINLFIKQKQRVAMVENRIIPKISKAYWWVCMSVHKGCTQNVDGFRTNSSLVWWLGCLLHGQQHTNMIEGYLEVKGPTYWKNAAGTP